MKILIGFIFTAAILSGCSSSKKSAASNTAGGESVEKRKIPGFIEDHPAPPRDKTKKGAGSTLTGTSEKSIAALHFKYAILLDIPVEEIDDDKMFSFIEAWYGTPYRYGGFSKDGIDCSAFTQTFFTNLYRLNIPRIAAEQFNQSKRIQKKQLQEGDLVFFKTSGRSISHVGVYLRNNKFVHASTSSGVMISDLDEDYFARRYAGAGRVR